MKEIRMSMKDFDPNKKMAVNHALKRRQVMENNLKASIMIQAAKQLNYRDNRHQEIARHQEVADMLRKGEIPVDALVAIVDGKIKNFDHVIEKYEQKKLSQNGWLKEAEQSRLDEFKQACAVAKAEKEVIIKSGKDPEKKTPVSAEDKDLTQGGGTNGRSKQRSRSKSTTKR